jgi:16S rRNA A1518/A1519 N6-dimethyltransferase RsmA/KsgA/DIM1 with predicted DNA glycosylase/AP lyase activity
MKNNQAILDAKHYKKNTLTQRSLAAKVLDPHEFSPKDIVLDIGCGDGQLT